jgi:hypothetical protein
VIVDDEHTRSHLRSSSFDHAATIPGEVRITRSSSYRSVPEDPDIKDPIRTRIRLDPVRAVDLQGDGHVPAIPQVHAHVVPPANPQGVLLRASRRLCPFRDGCDSRIWHLREVILEEEPQDLHLHMIGLNLEKPQDNTFPSYCHANAMCPGTPGSARIT